MVAADVLPTIGWTSVVRTFGAHSTVSGAQLALANIAHRPLLLLLVLGVFLAIIGITATAQSRPRRRAFLDRDAQRRRRQRRRHDPRLRQRLRAASRTSTPATRAAGRRPARLEARLAALTSRGEIVRIEIRRPDGSIVVANDPNLAGASAPVDAAFAASLGGDGPGGHRPGRRPPGAAPGDLGTPTVVREFLPISIDGRVQGVVGIWRDAVPILERLDAVRREVVLVTLSAAPHRGALLLLIFRSAQSRLTRQTAALVESTRRDPLTGALNHGAIVGALVERDRRRPRSTAGRSASPSSTSTT